MRGAPAWLVALVALFGGAVAALVAASFLRPAPETYAPTVPRAAEVGEALVQGVYTVDARDPASWVFFDLSRRSVVRDPGPLEWDLAFRRFRVVVNGGEGYAGDGGALRLDGPRRPGEQLELPADGYAGTRARLDDDPSHSVLDDWYEYGWLTHLLTPRPAVFGIRTADGRYAAIRFLGYYCPGASPGCVTFRFVYRGDGGRSLPVPDAEAGPPDERGPP